MFRKIMIVVVAALALGGAALSTSAFARDGGRHFGGGHGGGSPGFHYVRPHFGGGSNRSARGGGRQFGSAQLRGGSPRFARDGGRHFARDGSRKFSGAHRAQRDLQRYRDGRTSVDQSRKVKKWKWSYDRRHHGPRFRHRHGRNIYFHGGWWYPQPWWGYGGPAYGGSYDAYGDSYDYGASNSYGYAAGSSHVQWCLNHYRSYDPSTDTFMGHDGYRHRCNSPFDGY